MSVGLVSTGVQFPDGSIQLTSVKPAVPGLVTANTTLVSNSYYRLSGNNKLTVTLPTTPKTGDIIYISDGQSINLSANVYHTINRNNINIMGYSEDLILNIPDFELTLWYNGSEWRIN